MHIQNFDPYDFSRKEIAGVPVYYKHLPWAPCVHVHILFTIGAFSDLVGKEGLAYFLKHMLFQGSPTLPNEKAIREFEKKYTLNSLNASTGYYRTEISFKTLPEHLEQSLLGVQDLLRHSYIREADVEHERKVITQEAWRVYKNEKFLAYSKEYGQTVYPEHNKARSGSPLGWPETIQHISREDLVSLYEKYVKENMTVILAGNVTEETLVPIKTFLEAFPSGEKVEIVGGPIHKPLAPRCERNSDDIGDPQEQVEFSIERVMSPLSEKEDVAKSLALSLLYDILFEKLRVEHSLCYRIQIGGNSYKDYITSYISVKTSEDKTTLVEKEIWNIITSVIDGAWQERFLSIQKTKLEQIRAAERLSDDIASNVVEEIIQKNTIKTLAVALEEREKVTYTDIVAIIRKIFDPEYCFTEIILPSKKTNAVNIA